MPDSTIGAIPLGRSGISVSRLGYGSMPLSGVYGHVDDSDALRMLRFALDTGVDFIDTSNIYAAGHVEELVGAAVRGRRADAVVATKFGMQGPGLGVPEKVRAAVEGSLRRLDTDYIDLLYLHQIDPTTPIEDTVGAMAELITEGKVRALGLSEITPSTLRRAHQTYPMAAVQEEYSLMAREVEVDLLPVVHELGVSLVAYSPLGRGLLTGTLRRPEDLPSDDVRPQRYPRFERDALRRNLRTARPLFRLAEELGVSPITLALGWVLASHNTIPIPGTRWPANFDELLDVARSTQPVEVTRRLTRLFPVGSAHGAPYAPQYQQRLDEAP